MFYVDISKETIHKIWILAVFTVNSKRQKIWKHLNWSSKELGGWNEILAIFAKFLYSVHADIVGGSEKVQNYADVI